MTTKGTPTHEGVPFSEVTLTGSQWNAFNEGLLTAIAHLNAADSGWLDEQASILGINNNRPGSQKVAARFLDDTENVMQETGLAGFTHLVYTPTTTPYPEGLYGPYCIFEDKSGKWELQPRDGVTMDPPEMAVFPSEFPIPTERIIGNHIYCSRCEGSGYF